MYIVLSFFAILLFLAGFISAKTDKPQMFFLFCVGASGCIFAGSMARFEFKSMWIGAIFAFSPIFIATAIWWFLQKRRSKITTTLSILALLLVGCDRTVPPEESDINVGIANVEDFDIFHKDRFVVHIENRILMYHEDELDHHPVQLNGFHESQPIRIVRRGQQYYFTTGGNLVPFN